MASLLPKRSQSPSSTTSNAAHDRLRALLLFRSRRKFLVYDFKKVPATSQRSWTRISAELTSRTPSNLKRRRRQPASRLNPRWFKEGNLAKKAVKRAVARRAVKKRAVKTCREEARGQEGREASCRQACRLVKRRVVKKAVKRRAVKRAVVKRALVKRAVRRAVLAQLLNESGSQGVSNDDYHAPRELAGRDKTTTALLVGGQPSAAAKGSSLIPGICSTNLSPV